MKPRQGTVWDYDESTRSGHVLLDDGTSLPFAAAAFDLGGLRLLRLGQRVRFTLGPEGDITSLTILTLPGPETPHS
ncbi:MAG: hypothetical protein AVDCRST_MAG21-395 [uncultured Nocardioidaceae bacterium]|uniref:Uncharacterized protein n=1 Tax=uncultured Nocardioidaceae bacterium TaxID=253824 RepID=A0A6J4MWB5_9ACTN|nr:MAG: hypothetical protein AVDCRST_MAG21-395 [uncultured Nocardioidaceae bacterium]